MGFLTLFIITLFLLVALGVVALCAIQMMVSLVATLFLVLFLGVALYLVALRMRNMDRWIGHFYYSKWSSSKPALKLSLTNGIDQPVDIFIAVCDHYEPQRDNAPKDVAIGLVHRWRDEYPNLFEQFRDSSGRPPQHTFFFPQDEYAPEYLDGLKPLCEAGFGDVDVHLHHDNDTAEGLREKLESFRETLFHQHGFLRRDPVSNEIVYGFIHGNWALCNSQPDGRMCGVNQELTVLMETGCYADFTMPSAPSATQTPTLNSIYYAADNPDRGCGHFTGIPAASGKEPVAERLLMIQGPLVPDWGRAKWKVLPRIENGDLHDGRPGDMRRFQMWLDADVHVAAHPNWKFVKLHTHGCKEGNIDTLLGSETQAFHANLAKCAKENPNLRYHYVTAWEMAQLVHLAERSNETNTQKLMSRILNGD